METPRPRGRPEAPKGGKHDRLLHLLILLQGGPPRSAHQLAGVLRVSTRSIFRYLRALDRCMIPYDYDPSAPGCRVREDFFVRPPR